MSDAPFANRHAKMTTTSPGGPIVGCWPGRSFDLNPFIPQFHDALEAAGCEVVDVRDPRRLSAPVEVLHIHWPEQIFWAGGGFARMSWRAASTLRALFRLKRGGTRLVWMVHNLRPHELSKGRGILWRVLGPAIAELADGFMTLSPTTIPVVQDAFPMLRGKPSANSWLPVPAPIFFVNRESARHSAGYPVDARVLTFLGLIRPYKGVDTLIKAFRSDTKPNYRLVIAGRCESDGLQAELRRLAAGDDRIQLKLERLTDEAFARITVEADVIVLPFVDYLHSSSIIHALAYGRPVITPSTPFSDALAREVGSEWIETYEGQLSSELLASVGPPQGAPDLSMLDAAKLGRSARVLYETLLAA